MSKKIYEQAKKNYPEFWNREMIDHLHDRGRLTDEEYQDILSQDSEEE